VPILQLSVDGRQVEVPDDGASLAEVLRDRLGVHSVKDGCSPQGQCGCCTVLVDGGARVSCVTPARRVAGREITTLDGLEPAERQAWGDAFCATGGSQCGFCTPGIIVRLSGLRAKGTAVDDRKAVDNALAAHLCRCTGWQTIHEAWETFGSGAGSTATARDLDAASARAELEGHAPQRVSPTVALGEGGFADDTAPPDALVAVRDADGDWVLAETLDEARAAAAKVQGRRTTVDPEPPLALPDASGEPWVATLRTSWIEPAYLETDASWCAPGGEPASPLGNGGAFGGKVASPVGEVARALADQAGRPVRVLLSREDTVRLGPKRPPVAGAIRADGTGTLRVVRTPGIVDAVAAVAPDLVVEEADAPGPPTSAAVRAAGWGEAAVLRSALEPRGAPRTVTSPAGATATAEVGADGAIHVSVRCGDPLDEVVLRSYAIGAAHMALGWVTSEGLAVDDAGQVHDLTVRSFGILRAADMPPVHVVVEPDDGPPVNGSDAVFVAVAAAIWDQRGRPVDWPCGEG